MSIEQVFQKYRSNRLSKPAFKERIINSFRELSGDVVSKLKPIDVNRIDDFFQVWSDYYILASSSLHAYAQHLELPAKRKFVAWSYDIVFWLLSVGLWVGIIVIKIYGDKCFAVKLAFILFGIPFDFVPNKHLCFIILSLLFFFTAVSRLIVLLLEKKHQLEFVEICLSIRYSADKSKLGPKYYAKFCFFVELSCNYLLKSYRAFIVMACLITLGGATLYSYINSPEVLFSYTMIYGVFLWTGIMGLVFSVLFSGFFAYFGSVLYLIYRFKQVNQMIKDCGKNINLLMSAIQEHHELCSINERNNRLLRLVLLQLYYISSTAMDLCIIQVMYLDTMFVVRFVFGCGIITMLPLVYSMAYISAYLSKASRGSYNDLNSIIAREGNVEGKRGFNKIRFRNKIKIINLIERLAQTEITVWCADFFPLTHYEFYLYVAGTAKNFFLFVDLIGKILY